MDAWESRQGRYIYTVEALRRFEHEVNAEAARQGQAGQVRVVLICGADMLASFLVPGVWSEEDMREILDRFGVVCIYRDGTDIEALMATPVSGGMPVDLACLRKARWLRMCFLRAAWCEAPTNNSQGNILHEYRHRITLARDPFINNLSSSLVRKCIKDGLSVKYTVPEAVHEYIRRKDLYR